MPLDLVILKFINVTIANPAFDLFFKYIGDLRLWSVPILIAVILLLWKGGASGRWMVLLCVVTVVIVDSSIHLIIKPLFSRLRPCHADPPLAWLRLIAGCGGKYGFVSSHAANTFSQAVIVGAFHARTRIYMFAFAAAVSLSRIYLGAHYPSDVLAGAIYGALIAFIIAYAARTVGPRSPVTIHDARANSESDA